MKINQTLFFITLVLSFSLTESIKNQNTQGQKNYQRRKDAADSRKAAKPKIVEESLEDKENTVAGGFRQCTDNQWKDIKDVFSQVEAVIKNSGITSAPKNFGDLQKEHCRMSNSKGPFDSKNRIDTYRFLYNKVGDNNIYFPIVVKQLDKYTHKSPSGRDIKVEVLGGRTISAQENPLLTNFPVDNSPSAVDEKLTEEIYSTTQTNEEQEEIHEQKVNEQADFDLEEQKVNDQADLDLEEQKVNDQADFDLEEQPVNKELIEAERIAAIYSNGKSVHHPEEHNHEPKNVDKVNKELIEAERIAAIYSDGKSVHHLEEYDNNNEKSNDHNHIKKHTTHEDDTNNYVNLYRDHSQEHNIHNDETKGTDEEPITNYVNLHHDHPKDIKDHINASDKSTEEEEHNNKKTHTLLGDDKHDIGYTKSTEEEEEEEHNNKKTHTLLGDDKHDIGYTKSTEEEEEDSKNKIVPLFSEPEYDLSPKKPSTKLTNDHYFHDVNHDEYNLFENKHINQDKERDLKDLDDNETQNKSSKFQPCSDEKAQQAMAYVTKITLSGKVLGLIPTLQNFVECYQEGVTEVNYNVIVEINHDVCEIAYHVDSQNIIHDLSKAYIRKEVPCVDMYARRLF